MDNASDRLAWARRYRAGYATASAAARAFGWAASTYMGHENGSRSLRLDTARKYGKAYRVNPYWLLTGEGNPEKTNLAPVIGHMGTGAEIHLVDNHANGAGLDYVEAPSTGDVAVIAVIVRGDSMLPAYRDGDIIFYDQEPAAPEPYLNKECVVNLVDGRKYLRTITKGSGDGLYTLTSWNASPIVDVEVESVVPVRWVQRG